MFSLPCAHCGKPEIVHGLSLEDLISETWDTRMYHEEPVIYCSNKDADSFQSALEYLFVGSQGYRYSLHKCPGFSYRKKDVAYMIERYCGWIFEWHRKEVPDDDELVYYMQELNIELPSITELLKMAKEKLLLFEKEDEEKRGGYSMQPTTVFIIVDSFGHSAVGMGD